MLFGNVLIYILVRETQQPGYPYNRYSAMSSGYRMGDIMAMSKLALKVIVAYKDAPGDYRNISDEVESLHIITKKAAQHFESTTLSDNSRQEGQKVPTYQRVVKTYRRIWIHLLRGTMT